MDILSATKQSGLFTVSGLLRVVLAVALISLIFYYPGAISSPYNDRYLHGYHDNKIVEQANNIESIEHPQVTDETSVY